LNIIIIIIIIDLFHDPIVRNENIQAYNIQIDQQHEDNSFLKKIYGGFGFSKNNNYQKINDNQYDNLNSNNMYLIHSDSVFQYNTMGMGVGMEDVKKIKPINDDMSYKNNDETLVNSEKTKIRNDFGFEPEINQKSLDSERTEFENNNRIYEAMTNNKLNFSDSMFKGTSSTTSSIPLPPNSENMVFMGKEAQEELMIFQQKNNLNVNSDEETRSVKEQLEELEQMASNNYVYGSKSPKPYKSPKSPKSVKSPKPTKSPSNNVVVDYDCTNGSVDINDQIQELKNCSFNGLDLNSENFHNSKTFDKIEKKFLSNLNSLRNTTNLNNSTVIESNAESKVEDSKNKEANFFANIPGLQIQEYYNQLNFSMEESNNNGWNNKDSIAKNEGEEKKFDKIIPSGIFTTNKTSWDDEDSFFSNESSVRNTKKTEDFSTSINSSALNKEIKSKLGTESMMIEGENYNSESDDDEGYSKYKSGYTEDSRYKSGVTDDRYSKYTSYTEDSRYKSGVTDDRYSKYTSYTEDSRYKSGVTDDRYSKYTSYTEDSRYKSGVTDEGYSRYKSGVTNDDGYSRYTEDESRIKTLSIDPSAFDSLAIDRDSKLNSGYSSYTNVVITDVDNKKLSTNTRNTDSTNYTDSTNTISKDFSNTGYSSGFTLSTNANTLSSGFTFSTNEKTMSNGSSLEPPRTNSSRTTKTSSNLNQVSTITTSDSFLSSFSKYSSFNTMDTVSSLSFSDDDSK